jgi:hypothetical protein
MPCSLSAWPSRFVDAVVADASIDDAILLAIGREGQIASIRGLSRAGVVAGLELNFLLVTVMAFARATIMVACWDSTVRWDQIPS